MSNEITKPEVQTIPSMEMKGIESTLAEIKADADRLPALRSKADAVTVTNPATYAAAGQLLTQVRSVKKGVGFKLAPYDQIVKNVMNFLRGERTRFETEVQAIDDALSGKMAEYSRKEREAAAAEERRLNEDRRRAAEKKAEEDRVEALRVAKEKNEKRVTEIKAALKAGEIGKREAARLLREVGDLEEAQKQQAEADAAEAAKTDVAPVKVQPKIPTVPGTRRTVNWKFRILDQNRLPRTYMMPNEQKIGADVRFIKDKAKAEAEIPGIEVYTEDNI